MRAIPAAVETLLKSRAQAGANAHNHLITLSGAAGTAGLLDPATWTTWRVFVGSVGTLRKYGNMTETSDGKAIISYIEGTSVYVAIADTVAEVLDGTKTFGAGAEVLADVDLAQSSLALIDGKLHLVITTWYGEDTTGDKKAEYWRDEDGTGASFSLIATIANDLVNGQDHQYTDAGDCVSEIQELGGGAWIVLLPYVSGLTNCHIVYYSTNDGATWTKGEYLAPAGRMSGVSPSVLKLTETSFVVSFGDSSSVEMLQHLTDNGATKASVDWGADWPDDRPRGVFITAGSDVYFAVRETTIGSYNIYRLIADVPDITNIVDYEDWQFVTNVVAGGTVRGTHFILTTNALILQHTTDVSISGAGTTVGTQTIRAKRIEINRNKGMASSATVVFDNKAGIYSPDKAVGEAWKNVMFPNNGILIDQGYGTELIRTFSGTIDDVVMTTFPAEITLICRDYLKRAYDQLITSGGTHSITYTNFTPEAMFTALAGLAGWAAGDIHTEVTGLTIAEKIFQNETYGDAFSWLADMCGFMVYCDEDGDIYYVADDDDAVPTSDYAFAEGEDIISLGYTISDRDLYNKIICIGNEVSYEVTYYNTYNILAGKKMLINASEATAEAQCQAIAEQARYVMNSRARICEFAAICNPYLQIGDTLTVTETTTLISELYKITDISTSQSPDGGYIQHITCYHYAAPAES